MAVEDNKGFAYILKKNIKEIIFSLIYIVFSSYVFEYFQKRQFCNNQDNCLFWGGFTGYLMVNICLGWMLCYYLIIIIKKGTLTKLTKYLFPIVLIMYCLGIYYFFGYYSVIADNNLNFSQSSFNSSENILISDIKSIYFTSNRMPEGGSLSTYYAILKNGSRKKIQEGPANYLYKSLNIPLGLFE